MARQTTFTHAELRGIKLLGGRYLVVAASDIGHYKRGSVISWHRTYDAASKTANVSSFYGITHLDDALADVRES
jgi:hypothetical protein